MTRASEAAQAAPTRRRIPPPPAAKRRRATAAMAAAAATSAPAVEPITTGPQPKLSTEPPARAPEAGARPRRPKFEYALRKAAEAKAAKAPLETIVPERTVQQPPVKKKKRFFTRGTVGLLALTGVMATDIIANEGDFLLKPITVGVFKLGSAGLQTDTGKATVAYIGNEISRRLELDKAVAVEGERLPITTLTQFKVDLLKTAINVLHSNNRGADLTTSSDALEKMNIDQVSQIRRQVFSVSTTATDALAVELDGLIKTMTEHQDANDAVDKEEYKLQIAKAQYEAEHLLTEPHAQVVTAAVERARKATRFAVANEELISNAAAGDNDSIATLGIQLIDRLGQAQLGRNLLIVAKERGSSEAATRLVAIERAEREQAEAQARAQARLAQIQASGEVATCTVTFARNANPACTVNLQEISKGQHIAFRLPNGRVVRAVFDSEKGQTAIFRDMLLEARVWAPHLARR